jgi:hypothetical protein
MPRLGQRVNAPSEGNRGRTFVSLAKRVALPPLGVPVMTTNRSASPPLTTALTRCHARARASSTIAAFGGRGSTRAEGGLENNVEAQG